MNEKEHYTLTLRMSHDLKDKLEYLQEKTALSKSGVIKFAIAQLYFAFGDD